MSKIKEKSRKMNRFITRYKITPIALFLFFVGSFLIANFTFSVNITEKNIISLTNKERNKSNLSVLKENELLKKAAQNKAKAIIESKTFAHTINEKSFSHWIKEVGYEYGFIGENLAIDFVSSEGTIEAWLKSPTHKENLLNDKFEEIGVAVVEGKFDNSNTILVVQIFGAPIQSFNKIIEDKEKKQQEKLLVELKDDQLINNETSFILSQKNKQNTREESHLLLNNSKINQFYSFLFAIIVSSLVVSLLFPNGFKIDIKRKEQLALKLSDNKQKL